MAVVFEEGWRHAGGGALGLDPLTLSPAPGPRVLVLDSRAGRGAREVASVFAAIAGSALDMRSFEANAECNYVILDRETASRLEARYREDLASSVAIESAAWKRRGRLHRLLDAAARRLSPVL
jgi:phosphatidylserine/phosphatidylglycerophosphate/cardiolipin synthase-like enzyme